MRCLSLLLLLTLLPGCATSELANTNPTTDDPTLLQSLSPDPRYTPEQVVRIVLISMKHNDQPIPDSGIATAFRFASPASRERTGPLEQFVALVKTPTFSPLLNCRSIAISPILTENSSAELIARVIDDAGHDAFYYIALSVQSGGQYDHCWMTDSVLPIPNRDDKDYGDDNLFLRVPKVQYALHQQ